MQAARRRPAGATHLVALSKDELRKACASYPVFLVKHPETARFYPAALLGLRAQENLYWTGSALDAAHVPSRFLRQPFYTVDVASGGGQLCLDRDSAAIDAGGDAAIVEGDGTDSDYIRGIVALLSDMAVQAPRTDALVDLALRPDLVTPARLDIMLDSGERVDVDGLYAIDDAALARQRSAIPDFDDLLALMAMMLSLEKVADLVRRRNALDRAAAQWTRMEA
ncbi:SapC family protein [Sphingomonas silueang]|uniref:SapC family protein n=1 Tax=Sphingomonas silueang TaxID=3156617 RepID=UPI0032B52F61